MTLIKFSKIDIGSMQRKQKAPVKKNIIKREAFEYDLRLISHSPKVEKLKEIIIDAPVRNYSSLLFKMATFASLGIVLVLILQGLLYLSSARSAQGEILGAATSAYTELNSAGKNLGSQDFAQALTLFQAAKNNIQNAQNKLNDFKALQWLTPQASSANHILLGAGFLAEAGQKLTAALNLLDEFKVTSHGVGTADFNQKISDNAMELSNAQALIKKALDEFNAVGSIPLDYSQEFNQAKQQVSQLNGILGSLIGMENLYLDFFNGDKTYLLAFENYDEMRATGGFIGTYGVLKIHQGGIVKLKIASIYDLDGNIHEQIAAPGPMQPNIKKWRIRDANWFADFPTTASKLLDFFEKGNETADGVIAATPKLFEDLLRLVGPIDMPAYDATLTSDNFQEIVQFKTSIDYDPILNQPKKMLDDFAPLLLDRLSKLSQDQWIEAFQIIQNNLTSRRVVMYSKDLSAQTQIEKLGYSGAILNTDYDYLAVIDSNLGGTKTDLKVKQQVFLSSKILSDSSVINTLQITRNNTALANNKDFLRVMVPLGSQFISATGFDAYDYYPSASAGMSQDPDLKAWDQGTMSSGVFTRTESGKTEFSGWINTPPGQARTVTLTYILPFKPSLAYSLLVQKQIGSSAYQFAGMINLGPYRSQWVNSDVSTDGKTISFNSNSNTDDFWAVLLTR